MGYFDSEENVEQYLAMAAGYDGAKLISDFSQVVPKGVRVLELGMGGGTDLDLLLKGGYDAVGSDSSQVFVDRYRKRNGKAPTLTLDARSLETEERFDAIFSNKVLQHLSREEMKQSLARQSELLKPGGVLFHTLWLGEGEEQHHGLMFTSYTRETLSRVVPESMEIVEFTIYTEMEDNDSFWASIRHR